MTKFINMFGDSKKERKRTSFKRIITERGYIGTANTPSDFDNVAFLGHDVYEGDLFLCWNDDPSRSKVLFYGKKGDEFD